MKGVLWDSRAQEELLEVLGKEKQKASAVVSQIEAILESWFSSRAWEAISGIKPLKGKFRSLWQLSRKGGALGKTSLRVIFVLQGQQCIILTVFKKQKETQEQRYYRRALRRWREHKGN